MPYKTDIKTAVEMFKENPKTSFIFNLMETDLFASFVFTDPSLISFSLSAESVSTAIGMCGYQETYNMYLSQFQKQEVNHMLEHRY